MPMIKNLLFDLGGVLIDLDVRRTLDAFRQMMTSDPVPEGATVTAGGLLGGHDSHLMNLYQTGMITTEEFMQSVLSTCHPGTTPEQVREAWFAMLLGIKPAKQELLRRLKREGYHVYILSNINEMHVDWTMEHCPVLRELDGLFFSNEMHLAKPDPRCYETVIRDTGIVPDETIYIDDLLPNIEGGRAYGFHCIQAVDDSWMDTLKTAFG